MTPEAFALLFASCGIALPPGITVDRLSAIAQVESNRTVETISPPNRDGSRDYGIMQINEQWLARFGVTRKQVMEPCTNLRIGVALLADADRQSSCIWNTGRPNCRNGYDLRIQAASARLTGAEPPRPPAPPEPATPHAWDVWAETTQAPEPSAGPEAAPDGNPRLIVELNP